MSSEVPEGWQHPKLGDIVALEYGRSLPDKVRRSGTVPVFGSNGIVGWHDEALVPSGGIIVGRKGTAGSVTVSPDPFWPIDTTYFVKPRQCVDPDWLAATLHHARLNELNEATGVPGLNREKAYLQPIFLPPLDEQRRIAEVLRSVDEVIATTDQALIAARGLKRTLTEAFLSESQDAPLVRLREVVSETGSGWSPNCDTNRAAFDEWAVLKTSAITWDGYCDDENKRLPSDLEPRPQLAVRANDILITRAGQAYRTGVVAMVHDTCGMRMISDKMIRVRADRSKIFPVVLCEILKSRSVQGQLNPLKSGLTTLTNVTQKMVANVTFRLPSVDIQRGFALSIEAVAADIHLLQDEANALTRLKPALQADLLSGRVRVPV